MGDLTGDGRMDVVTWNARGELRGLSHEGHPLCQRVAMEKTERREIRPSPSRGGGGLPHREEYAIAVLDEEKARFGGDLIKSKQGWANLAQRLPLPSEADSGFPRRLPSSLRHVSGKSCALSSRGTCRSGGRRLPTNGST